MELAFKRLSSLVSNLFPSRCILCSNTVTLPAVQTGVELCEPCHNRLPFNKNNCTHCALPLAAEVTEPTLCGRCIKAPPKYDYSHSIFRYEEEIISLVHQLKFSEKITYARSLGQLLSSAYEVDYFLKNEKPECLLPVPLHTSRLRQRGFNQSIEIARTLSKQHDIPIEYNAVVRQRITASQTGLNAKQRQTNINGAFNVIKKIPYKHMLIIDDVVTTGATVNALAKLLKKNNVERVGVLSIARAPMKF